MNEVRGILQLIKRKRRRLKVVITGPHQAGKTTFLRSLSRDVVEVSKRDDTTTGFDYARIDLTLDGARYSCDVYSLPGQERFSEVRKTLAAGASGAILVVDSANPASIGKAYMYLSELKAVMPEVKVVVAANKQDLPNAMKPEEVKSLVGFEEEVVGTSALYGRNTLETLKLLVSKVMSDG